MKNPTKEQVKRWNRDYYLRHKGKRDNRYYNQYKIKIREWFQELKLGLKCEECGFSHPAALCFHHKDTDTKIDDVSTMVAKAKSKKVILEEISKCKVLCHNCHAIYHYNASVA